MRKALTTLTIIAALTFGVAGAASAHNIEHDGIYARTTSGAQVSGTLHWLSGLGHGSWKVTVSAPSGQCAYLYWQQFNAAGVKSGWIYLHGACGGSITRNYPSSIYEAANTPYPRGTAKIGFAVGNSRGWAFDYNSLGGS